MTALEARHNFTQGMIWLLILGAAAISGLLLATNLFYLVALGIMLVWLSTLPYHSALASILGFTTMNASFLVPFLNGRPTITEASVMLAWTGVLLTLSMRRQDPAGIAAIRDYRWLWLSYLGFAAVVLFIMQYRGVGFGLSGSGVAGGRRYLRQLTSIMAPFALLLFMPGERLLKPMFYWHCLLSLSFVAAEFALTSFGGAFIFLLYFIDIPYDAVSFAMGRQAGQVERYQSLQIVSQCGLVLLCSRYSVGDFGRRRVLVFVPSIILLILLGLMSGHRFAVYFAVCFLTLQALAQRFFTVPRLLAILAGAMVLLTGAYTFARQLPLSAQRALCVLPYFPADPFARRDAEVTLEGRQYVRDLAREKAPQHRWVGRGFASFSGDLEAMRDPLVMHYAAGIWYNGTISLLINTGLPGLFFALFFLAAGARQCVTVIRLCRQVGLDDSFVRACCSMACWWLTLAISLVFLEGTAEQILPTFGLLSAFLIACEVALRRRLAESRAQAEMTRAYEAALAEAEGPANPPAPLVDVRASLLH